MGDFNSRLAQYQEEKREVESEIHSVRGLHYLFIVSFMVATVIGFATFMSNPVAGCILGMVAFSFHICANRFQKRIVYLNQQKVNLRYKFKAGK